MAKRAGDPPGCAGRIPWLHPWAHALFKIGDDPVCDLRIDVDPFAF
jgi:hypothetical protein